MCTNETSTVFEKAEEVNEKMAVSEVYDTYWPSKLELGRRHPSIVLEKASLSSVEPRDIYYRLDIPEETIESGQLSALQLESITYAAQAHDYLLPDGSRAGFFIGDGPGVGKSRTIAGIIYENFLKGRKKAIWVYVSKERKEDVLQDFVDIGATQIYFRALKEFDYSKISSQVYHKEGVIFSTYSTLIGESKDKTARYRSRIRQLLQWCGKNFEGLIIFDECHKAKNLCPVDSEKPTKISQTVLELQQKLPMARVVYVSSTGVSEPRNMECMVRLGLWGPGTTFGYFNDFITAIEKRGLGATELMGMDMKLRGMYIARQLSFKGVSIRVEEVPLTKEFRKIYDQSVELWVEARQKFTEAAELIDAESRMIMWEKFWSSHQRFFKYLSFAAKTSRAILVARESIKNGKCVVIGLQSTGEARTFDQLERDDGELADYVSTAKGVFQSFVERHFPAPDRNKINRILGLKEESSSPLESSSSYNTKNSSAAVASKRKGLGTSNGKIKKLKKRRGGGSDSYEEEADDENEENNDEDDDSDDHEAVSDMPSDASSDFIPIFGGKVSESDPCVYACTMEQNKKKVYKDEETEAAATPSTTSTDAMSAAVVAAPSAAKTHRSQVSTSLDAIVRACTMKEELLRKIERLGSRLPPNSLDRLIDELGGPENVAEMTGRRGRIVKCNDGSYKYEPRKGGIVTAELLNTPEKEFFMFGQKDVVIILEAVSSGISLHSDRREYNKRRRVHIILDTPWSPDQALLHFGRTHRANQVYAPEYIFLISDLGGERHFASTLAKRLESLGARTHGDRRATLSRDPSHFNLTNKYGKQALETVMRTIMGFEMPVVPPPIDYSGEFFKDIVGALVGVGLIGKSESRPGVLSLDKDYNNISKFLDRILGCPVDLQIRLFKYFTDTITAIILQAKRSGRFDLGVADLCAAGRIVTRVRLIRFLRKHATGVVPTDLHTIRVERGMSWQDALYRYADIYHENEGFYVSHQLRNQRRSVIMVVNLSSSANNSDSSGSSGEDSDDDKKGTRSKREIMCQIFRPHTGLQVRHESLFEVEKKYRKVRMVEAEAHWTEQYDASLNMCTHMYWSGNCRNDSLGNDCEVGLRQRLYHILTGCVLSVWGRVEHILNTRPSSKMQVIRMKTITDEIIMGILIPKSCLETLIRDLRSDSEDQEEFFY